MLSTSPLEPATCDAFRSHTTKRKPRTTLGESERGCEVLVQDGNPRTQKGRVGKSRPLLSTVFAVSTRVGSLLPLHMAERLAFSPATPESVCVCVRGESFLEKELSAGAAPRETGGGGGASGLPRQARFRLGELGRSSCAAGAEKQVQERAVPAPLWLRESR